MEDGASSLADEESLDGKYRIESWPRQFISRQGAKHNTSQLWLIYKNSSAGAFLPAAAAGPTFVFSHPKQSQSYKSYSSTGGRVNLHLKLNEILHTLPKSSIK